MFASLKAVLTHLLNALSVSLTILLTQFSFYASVSFPRLHKAAYADSY